MTPPYLRRKTSTPSHTVKAESMIGEVVGHKAGYGFVVVGNRRRLFLATEEMNRVLDKDLVKVAKIYDSSQEREQAKIIEVLARKQDTFLGYYREEEGESFIIPCNSRIPRAIYVDRLPQPIGEDAVVRVKLLNKGKLELPTKLRGKLMGVAGSIDDARIETDIAINTYGLEDVFPAGVLKEVNRLPDSVDLAQHSDRNDLTHIPFVTMDGYDARDYDDAVFCHKDENGVFHLLVAIADVAHYVRPNSQLDKHARLRTSSAYFPDRVLPMLPEKLSNGLCSLNPDCYRLAMVCELLIDQQGKRQKVNFYKAVIRSQARLVYDEMAQLMADDTNRSISQDKLLSPEIHVSLRTLEDLTKVLLQARQGRAALDFNYLEEVKADIDTQGRVEKIYTYQRAFAHRMIEEAMLAANDATAWFLSKKGVPFPYRVHKPPKNEDFAELKLFLSNYGIKVPYQSGERITTRIYDYLLKAVGSFPEAPMLEAKILRSLQRAEYTHKNTGHFGLNYKSYTHFTSPIRRYVDLMVHRAIKKVTMKEGSGRGEYPYTATEVGKIATACTQQETAIEHSVWQVMDGLKCRYLEAHGQANYEGRVTTVLEFGFYVRLADLPIEGLVHIRNLHNDYYSFDRAQQKLVGRRSKQEYKLGGRIKVRIKHINTDERKIDLVPL